MNIYGHGIYNDLSNSESKKISEIPIELKEVCFELSLEELDELIEYLQYVKDKHESIKNTAYHPHTHYSDWKGNMNEIVPDIIISTLFERNKPLFFTPIEP